MKKTENIDIYIADYPKPVQDLLKQMRQTIKKAAPDAEEAISYGIPTFKLKGNLVHFGGFKNHISFFPGAGPVKDFAEELVGYKTSKGTIQFPFDKPLPLELVTKITKYRVIQNLAKHEQKKTKK